MLHWHMIRVSFFLQENAIEFLKAIDDVPLSEHIRRAVSDYMDKIKNLNASKSPTIVHEEITITEFPKGDDKDG